MELLLKFLLLMGIIYAIYTLVVSMLWGAPYVPSSRETVKEMLQLAGDSRGRKMVDLGSGDGRIVEAFARQGFEAVGYEIAPLLVWYSRFRLWRLGLHGQTSIASGDMWRADFSSFQLVTVFGMTHIMGKLEYKLQSELAPGAEVITHYYHFPNWQPVESLGRLAKYRVRRGGARRSDKGRQCS